MAPAQVVEPKELPPEFIAALGLVSPAGAGYAVAVAAGAQAGLATAFGAGPAAGLPAAGQDVSGAAYIAGAAPTPPHGGMQGRLQQVGPGTCR